MSKPRELDGMQGANIPVNDFKVLQRDQFIWICRYHALGPSECETSETWERIIETTPEPRNGPFVCIRNSKAEAQGSDGRERVAVETEEVEN